MKQTTYRKDELSIILIWRRWHIFVEGDSWVFPNNFIIDQINRALSMGSRFSSWCAHDGSRRWGILLMSELHDTAWCWVRRLNFTRHRSSSIWSLESLMVAIALDPPPPVNRIAGRTVEPNRFLRWPGCDSWSSLDERFKSGPYSTSPPTRLSQRFTCSSTAQGTRGTRGVRCREQNEDLRGILHSHACPFRPSRATSLSRATLRLRRHGFALYRSSLGRGGGLLNSWTLFFRPSVIIAVIGKCIHAGGVRCLVKTEWRSFQRF